MKKALTIVLTLVMMLSLCTAAFAASDQLTNNKLQTAFDVFARYDNSTEGATVISVDVEWGAMEFIYHTEAQDRWDPTQHKEVTAGQYTWTEIGNTITVKNHSNANIYVNIAPQSQNAVWNKVKVSIENQKTEAVYTPVMLQNAATFAPLNPGGADYVIAEVHLALVDPSAPEDHGLSNSSVRVGELVVAISENPFS